MRLLSLVTELPSPTQGVWNLGPIPLRAYALCILAGIGVAIWLGERRWIARGGQAGQVLDLAAWGVPMGIIGGRLYHVVTSPEAYFGPDGHLLDIFKIWEGGLGIWGGIALGIVGVWIGARRAGLNFVSLLDALAPGVLFAQALGRWGNWFNNELYGKATDAPWGLKIYDWDFAAGRAVHDASGNPVVLGTFQPTFLYESLWCAAAGVALIVLEKRLNWRTGQTAAAYLIAYTLGRFFIEQMRIDPASHVLGVRLNVWTAMLVFLIGAVWFLAAGRHQPVPVSVPSVEPEPIGQIRESVAVPTGQMPTVKAAVEAATAASENALAREKARQAAAATLTVAAGGAVAEEAAEAEDAVVAEAAAVEADEVEAAEDVVATDADAVADEVEADDADAVADEVEADSDGAKVAADETPADEEVDSSGEAEDAPNVAEAAEAIADDGNVGIGEESAESETVDSSGSADAPSTPQ